MQPDELAERAKKLAEEAMQDCKQRQRGLYLGGAAAVILAYVSAIYGLPILTLFNSALVLGYGACISYEYMHIRRCREIIQHSDFIINIYRRLK